ncbi:hypothetical protein OC498_12765 [Acinetobacter bohemicus]|uniref:Uncharacterized protein n=2 Tax=Acinetobacter TaxID=469 RepID=A0A9D2ZY30_ACILW|nr:MULTISPECIES: hypothetical protein [Acinetobacter]MCO8043523.1 hypothetical protein [Acinetobacter sp. S4400-12]MCO8044365.1 hypothetical protein [Acinetobacter sp. S4397-1]MCU7225753.1 hypothetical protein [Acinetobacter bohemicus]HJF26943.1 hypothetical protein [Acinetobacter lwoffii]
MTALPLHAEEETVAATEKIQPITQAEVQQSLTEMQQRLNLRIEQWGQSLQRDDFEWTWHGRKLKQSKRQEVCDIFQQVVNEMYQLMVENKARLRPEDQKLLSNRDGFIEKLGYQNNRVNTKMGFDCRLH